MVQWKQAVGDLEINVEQVGNGPHVILCLPGGLGFIQKDFSPLLERFDPAKFTLIAWDPPGYGQSRPPNRNFEGGAEMYVRDAILANELMQGLGHNKYSVLGFDGGANTACILASMCAPVVNKIVIWGGRAYFYDDELESYKNFANLDTMADGTKQEFIDCYGDEYFRQAWAQLTQSYTFIANNGGDICRTYLDTIDCPALVLHGTEDVTMHRSHAMYIKNHIANSEYIPIHGAGHELHLQFSEFFTSVVQQFLEGN